MTTTVRRLDPSHAAMPDEIPGAALLADGWMLTLEFSSTRGVKYNTETEERGDGVVMHKTVKYDDPRLQKACTKVINAAYATVRKHCAPLFAGLWFCTPGEFDKLDAALQEGRHAARVLNQQAKRMGSSRQTRVEVYPSRMLPTPRHALRAGQAIHEHLLNFRETWESDHANDYLMLLRDVQNLHTLVVGEQRAAILAALKSAEAQRPNMLQYATQNGRGPKVRNKSGEKTKLDYSEIDRAIALFAPAERAFLG